MECNSIETCFTDEALNNMSKELKIEKSPEINSKTDIANAINKKLRYLGRKKGPQKQNEPLSTSDINNAMILYTKIYPNFIFLGVFPIDNISSYNELSSLDFKRLNNTNSKLGVVWNTDVANKPGDHWICLFIDFKNNIICFFDSLNKETPSPIVSVLQKIQKNNPKIKVMRNNSKPQKNGSNCGIYVMRFIITSINSVCSECLENMPGNEQMDKFRYIVFD